MKTLDKVRKAIFGPQVRVEAYVTRAATGKTEHIVLSTGKGVTVTPIMGSPTEEEPNG